MKVDMTQVLKYPLTLKWPGVNLTSPVVFENFIESPQVV